MAKFCLANSKYSCRYIPKLCFFVFLPGQPFQYFNGLVESLATMILLLILLVLYFILLVLLLLVCDTLFSYLQELESLRML